MRDKDSTPSFGEAGICFAMIMLLQFAAMKFMQQAIATAAPGEMAERMMQLLMVQQIAIIASPALFMGVMLTTNVGLTFRLKWPRFSMLAVAGVLPFVLHPLSVELAGFLQKYFFLPLPSSFAQQISAMADLKQPLWMVLLAFAAAPAICEELAFRGFILSGFSRSKRVWLAIGLSSVMFGLMHMIPQQVFNASLLGLVLGLIAVRSGSLLPCVLFHFTWNSLAVLHGRLGQLAGVEQINESPWHFFLQFDAGQIHYRWPLLVAMTIVGGFIIRWLVKQPSAAEPLERLWEHSQEPASQDFFKREEAKLSSREPKPIASR
jgi:sodium transport system permease protein